MHDDKALASHEPAAKTLGVPAVRCRIQAFGLSAILAAVAGNL